MKTEFSTLRSSQQISVARWISIPRVLWQHPAVIVALYLALPNLCPLLAGGTLGSTPRGYINIEAVVLGAAGVFLPRAFVFALLIVEFFFDIAFCICYTYRFSPDQLLASIGFITAMPIPRVLAGFGFLSIGAILCWVLASARPRAERKLSTLSSLLVCCTLLTAVDLSDGQSVLRPMDATLVDFRLVRSPGLVLGLWELAAQRTEAELRRSRGAPVPSASNTAMRLLAVREGDKEPPDIVLVVVESWGQLLDPRLASELTAPYEDLRIPQRYAVLKGTVPFSGLTVPGEARELCQSSIGFGILRPSAELATSCLPALLHARGYRNLAVHGFAGQMFGRSKWYPQLGFDEMRFRPELIALGLPDCPGAFPGICDDSISTMIGNELLPVDDQPRFIYWVTLNSHLPVPAHPRVSENGVCASRVLLRDSVALCTWFRLVAAVHQSVALMALEPLARPTVFILVGDHAPPLQRSKSAGQVLR